MVEGARLEIVYTPKGYPGFESLSIRHLYKTLNNVVRGYFEKADLEKELKLNENQWIVVSQAVGWPKE